MNISLRRIAEKLARGRVLKRFINLEHGKTPIYVSPDAQLKYLKIGANPFDADLVKIADQIIENSHVVWDIGGNVGVFSFACAHKNTATIVIVEADIWLCSILRRTSSLKEYHHRDIRVLPLAVAEKNGISEFIIAKRGRASNALASAGGRSQMGGERERLHVPTLTLDTISQSQPKPDFIKIDVEGAELAVLEGAENLLSECYPTVYAEIGRSVFSECYELMRNRGYMLFGPDGKVTEHPNLSNYFFIHETQEKMLDKIQRFAL